MGGGEPHEPIVLPGEGEMRDRAELCRFPFIKLRQLQIEIDDLDVFVHPESPVQGAPGKSSLERRPLVRLSEEVILTLPAAVSPALRLHIAERVLRAGMIDRFQEALMTAQTNWLFAHAIERLGGKRRDSSLLSALPANAPVKIQEVAEFDGGKFAHILFFQDRVLQFLQTGMSGILEVSETDLNELLAHTKRCADTLATEPGYTGGLTVAVVGGLGRAFVFGVPELPTAWYATSFRLPDIMAIARLRHVDLLEIWKFHHRRHELENHHVRILEFNGELNFLGFYRQYGERFVPRDTPSRGAFIGIESNFLAEVRRDLRARYNLHAVERRNPPRWVPVRRENVDPFFKEAIETPIYVDEADISRGRLRGVVETDSRGWWISSLQQHQNVISRSIQYRIWDTFLSWMVRVAPVAETYVTEVTGPIEIIVVFEQLDEWTSQRIDDLPNPPGDVVVEVSIASSAIRITIPRSFFRHFAVPSNVAEQKLIRACFIGIGRLGQKRIESNRLDTLVRTIVRNENARFFHLVYAQDYRQNVGSTNAPKPWFIADGELNYICIGLSQRLLGPSQTSLEDQASCNAFLHKVVDDCWARIRSVLIEVDAHSTVLRALTNVEAIELDKEHWRLTASALLAIHQDQNDVISAAKERESHRAAAELASRVLAEMAVCTCPATGGRPINEADLHGLLAAIELLIEAAHSSDAIQYGLTPARINIFPNGEFSGDTTYKEKIMLPYIEEYFREQFGQSAEAYEDYFEDPRSMPDPSPTDFSTQFSDAFIAEFGITVDELTDAYQALANDALSEAKLVVSRPETRFREIVASAFQTSDGVDKFLRNFVLAPRDRWDTAPSGFVNKDWYPWRYRRRLSLIMRPFLQLADSDAQIVYAPGFVHDCVLLLLSRLLSGRLPADDFQSAQMRSWIGEITRQRGEEFEGSVAKEFQSAGLSAVASRPMTEFGADPSYGDLDVLAWTPDGRTFYLVECKRLRFARTSSEVGEQLREFRGAEMDRLARHIRRCDWLKNNLEAVRRVSNTTGSQITLTPLLVTSTVVPMQFATGLPLPADRVLVFSKLREWISCHRPQGVS
jgi:hypothetical protein